MGDKLKYDLLLEEVIRGGTTRIDAVPELVNDYLTKNSNISYVDIADAAISHWVLEMICESRFGGLTRLSFRRIIRPYTVHIHEVSDSLKIALHFLAFKSRIQELARAVNL